MRYYPEAEDEFRAVVDHYNRCGNSIGERFIESYEAAITSILQDPSRLPIVIDDVRRERVFRFPYDVYFREVDDEVLIVAVAHHHREPNDWIKRL